MRHRKFVVGAAIAGLCVGAASLSLASNGKWTPFRKTGEDVYWYDATTLGYDSGKDVVTVMTLHGSPDGKTIRKSVGAFAVEITPSQVWTSIDCKRHKHGQRKVADAAVWEKAMMIAWDDTDPFNALYNTVCPKKTTFPTRNYDVDEDDL